VRGRVADPTDLYEQEMEILRLFQANIRTLTKLNGRGDFRLQLRS